MTRSFVHTGLGFALILLTLEGPSALARAEGPQTPPPPAAASTQPEMLGVAVGAGYLGNLGLNGAVVTSGLRYAPLRHLALSFDLGYGVIRGSPEVQDRWWLMPAAALVLPAGPVQLDLGAGLGLGATSGYASWPAYAAAPFGPTWAFQLVPAARIHMQATMPLTERVDLYGRLELASLILGGTSLGSRVGNPHPRDGDTEWFALTAGIQFRLL